MYTGPGGMSLRPVAAARVTSTEVCSRGYKRAREGRGLKSLVSVSSGVELFSTGLRALERLRRAYPDRAPRLPFYRPREGPGVHKRERGKEEREKTKRKGALGLRHPSSQMGGSCWWCRR
jgi:hypothetical protein